MRFFGRRSRSRRRQDYGVWKVAQSLVSAGCAFDDAAEQQTQAAKAGAALIPVTGRKRHPGTLRDIFEILSLLLFARGRVELLATLMVGVVGTRDDRRPAGRLWLQSCRQTSAAAGVRRSLAGWRGGSILRRRKAFWRCGGGTMCMRRDAGSTRIYPAENPKLAEQIATQGLLITGVSE